MDTNQTNTITFQASELLKKHMRFISVMQQIFGVISIIAGAFLCLGIISAIMGIPQIIAGVKLFKSGSSFSLVANTQQECDIVSAIEHLYSYWKYALIAFIASIVFIIIYIVIIMAVLNNYYYYY
jgi:hypothetical protein